MKIEPGLHASHTPTNSTQVCTQPPASSGGVAPLRPIHQQQQAQPDDDLTKMKRINAISKLLKSDLIESFKASACGLATAAAPAIADSASSSSVSSPQLHLPPPHLHQYQQQQQQTQTTAFYSSPSSTCMSSYLSMVDDVSYVPNLTIEPSSTNMSPHANQMLFPATPSDDMDSKGGLYMRANSLQHGGLHHQQQQQHTNSQANSSTIKRLQEHLNSKKASVSTLGCTANMAATSPSAGGVYSMQQPSPQFVDSGAPTATVKYSGAASSTTSYQYGSAL